MRVFLILMLVSVTGLSACSAWRDSGANPRNWFGSSKSTPVASDNTGVPSSPSDRQTGNPLIEDERADVIVRRNVSVVQRSGILRRRNREVVYQGQLVDQVTGLTVESVPSGAIVRVKGEPLREGAFDVRLLRTNADGPINGVMEYTLNALQPADFGRGTQTTREVQAGAFLNNGELERINEIRVRGVRNIVTVKR